MASTKYQINYNIQKFNNQNSFSHLIVDVSNLFVICFLLSRRTSFGALIQILLEFMDRHYLGRYLLFRLALLFHSGQNLHL